MIMRTAGSLLILCGRPARAYIICLRRLGHEERERGGLMRMYYPHAILCQRLRSPIDIDNAASSLRVPVRPTGRQDDTRALPPAWSIDDI